MGKQWCGCNHWFRNNNALKWKGSEDIGTAFFGAQRSGVLCPVPLPRNSLQELHPISPLFFRLRIKSLLCRLFCFSTRLSNLSRQTWESSSLSGILRSCSINTWGQVKREMKSALVILSQLCIVYIFELVNQAQTFNWTSPRWRFWRNFAPTSGFRQSFWRCIPFPFPPFVPIWRAVAKKWRLPLFSVFLCLYNNWRNSALLKRL